MLAVMIGWVYFRSNTIFQANEYIKQMFSFKPSVHTSVLSYVSMWVIIALVIGVLFSGFVQRPLKSIYNRYSKRMPVLVADYSIQFVILVLAILLLVSGTYNPFIYFQF
jgi:alginate O-acetyltransferase complex protein AlgI